MARCSRNRVLMVWSSRPLSDHRPRVLGPRERPTIRTAICTLWHRSPFLYRSLRPKRHCEPAVCGTRSTTFSHRPPPPDKASRAVFAARVDHLDDIHHITGRADIDPWCARSGRGHASVVATMAPGRRGGTPVNDVLAIFPPATPVRGESGARVAEAHVQVLTGLKASALAQACSRHPAFPPPATCNVASANYAHAARLT